MTVITIIPYLSFCCLLVVLPTQHISQLIIYAVIQTNFHNKTYVV